MKLLVTYYEHLMEHLLRKNLGRVLAGGNMVAGDIQGKPELQMAFELGKSISQLHRCPSRPALCEAVEEADVVRKTGGENRSPDRTCSVRTFSPS